MPYEALPEVHWPEINITCFDDSDVLQDFEQLDIDLKQLMDRVKTHKTLWISENDKIQHDLSKIPASGRFLLKNWKWLGLALGGIGAAVLVVSAWGMCKMKGQMAKLATWLPVELVRRQPQPATCDRGSQEILKEIDAMRHNQQCEGHVNKASQDTHL